MFQTTNQINATIGSAMVTNRCLLEIIRVESVGARSTKNFASSKGSFGALLGWPLPDFGMQSCAVQKESLSKLVCW